MTRDEAKNKEQYAINRLQDAKDGYKEYLTDEALDIAIEAIEQTRWIPCSERFPDEDGDYYVTYEKGYAEDYDLPPIGIVGFEVDCESFGYWQEHFDIHTLGSLGSDWEEIPVTAWMPLPEQWKGE